MPCPPADVPLGAADRLPRPMAGLAGRKAPDREALERSARHLLASVIAGGGWLDPLESLMDGMNAIGGGVARTVPPRMFAIPTSGVRDWFAASPADPALRPAGRAQPAPAATDGFVADHMTVHGEARERDPFHREVPRPRGCAHRVSAFLDETGTGAVNLVAFRTERQGPFGQVELAAFDAVLPYLRSAAMVSRGALGGQARRQAEPYDRRGEPVLYLGPDGRVAEVNGAPERANGRLFEIVDRRVIAMFPADQARLDRALAAALTAGTPGLAGLSGAGAAMALVLPVEGVARDPFHAVSALLVVIDHARRRAVDGGMAYLLREAANLTERETDVVRTIATGSSPREAGEILGIGFGTVRLHLKAAFAKLGVHGQAELTDFVRRLG